MPAITTVGQLPPLASRTVDTQALDRFLAGVERRALRMAQVATFDHADALDLVQDAMLMLATRYAKKPEDQWRPLFYRILHNRINDWHRRRQVRGRWMAFLYKDDETREDPLEQQPDRQALQPEQQLSLGQSTEQLVAALGELPLRQQQAVMLRCWEGFDVAETAKVMGCSGGSVKTHTSRGLARLRTILESDDD